MDEDHLNSIGDELEDVISKKSEEIPKKIEEPVPPQSKQSFPVVPIIILLLVILMVYGLYYAYENGYFDGILEPKTPDKNDTSKPEKNTTLPPVNPEDAGPPPLPDEFFGE